MFNFGQTRSMLGLPKLTALGEHDYRHFAVIGSDYNATMEDSTENGFIMDSLFGRI